MGDLRPTILALCISIPLLAILSVALRHHARLIKRIEPGADDYMILVALVCNTPHLRS